MDYEAKSLSSEGLKRRADATIYCEVRRILPEGRLLVRVIPPTVPGLSPERRFRGVLSKAMEVNAHKVCFHLLEEGNMSILTGAVDALMRHPTLELYMTCGASDFTRHVVEILSNLIV